jgi:hypothetical protein
MIAVNGGTLLNLCFLHILARKLFRLTSFLGFIESCKASCSCTKALAISEQARRNLSFSGGKFMFSGFCCLKDRVIVSVAILCFLALTCEAAVLQLRG